MRVLGIDPSTKMGLIVLQRKNDEIITIYKDVYSSKHKGMQRLGDIGGCVIDVLKSYKPDMVSLEGYSFGSKFNHEITYSIGTVIRYFLWQSGYDYQILPPSTLKKFVTGKGNSKKDLMLLGVYKNWGFDTTDDNLSDAYGIALCTLFQNCGIADEKGGWKKGDAKHLTFDHSNGKANLKIV